MRNSFIGILAFTLFLFACEKPDSKIGLELLPEEEFLGLEIDTSSVLVSTVLFDSLNTTRYPSVLVGEMSDFELGDDLQSHLYFQIRLSDPMVSFGDSPVLDSMVLSLAYNEEFYGELTPMTFELKQLSEQIFLDSTYFSYDSIPTVDVSLIDPMMSPIVPDLESEVIVGGDTLAPQLRIRMDALGELLLNSTDSLIDDDTFLPFFKGLKLTANKQPGDNGGLFSLNPYSDLSKMTIYYSNSDTTGLSYDFLITQLNQQFTQYEHNYMGDVLDQIDGITTDPDQVYIQSLGGLGIQVSMPSIYNFAEEKNIIINKAVLELPLVEGQDLELYEPHDLIKAAIFEDGSVLNTPDGLTASQFGTSFEDGAYDEESEMYKLVVTRFVQQVLNGEIEEPIFTVIPARSRTVGNRAIIHVGEMSEDRRVKLIINYTTY